MKKKIPQVSIEDFAAVLEWFGPMDGINMLHRMTKLCLQNFFWGYLSSVSAEKILIKDVKEKGSFLLRFSTTEPGSYSLSAVTQECRLQHFRIGHKAGGKYILGKTEYDTLEDLLKNCNKQMALVNVRIKKPCSSVSPLKKTLEIHLKKVDPQNMLLGYGNMENE